MIADSANLPDLQQFSSNNLHIFSFGNASAHMATQRIEPRITVPFRLTIHIETSLKKDRGRSHSGIRLTRTQGRIHDMVIKFMIMWGALCFSSTLLRKIRCGSQRPLRPALKFQWLGLRVSALLGNPELTQSAKQLVWHVMTSTAEIWRSLASAAQSDEHPAQGVGASCYTEVEEIELSVLPLAGTGFWCSQKPHSATKRFRRQQALWFSEFSVLAAPLSSWAGLPIDSCRFRHDKTRTRDRICGMPKKTIVP